MPAGMGLQGPELKICKDNMNMPTVFVTHTRKPLHLRKKKNNIKINNIDLFAAFAPNPTRNDPNVTNS